MIFRGAYLPENLGAPAAPLPDPHFQRPVAFVEVGSGFGTRTLSSGKQQYHGGIDIRVPNGTPVRAIGDGEVIRLQKDPKADDGGIHVAIRHPNGMVSRYLHMMRYDVELGQHVSRGQSVGLSNNTGNSEGPHLHFELRVPKELLPRVEATVGRPTIGWGPFMAQYGVAIAPDSWIPVDKYRASTLVAVRRYKIPLYGEWAGSGGVQASNFAKLSTSSKAAIAGAGFLAISGVVIGLGLKRKHWS